MLVEAPFQETCSLKHSRGKIGKWHPLAGARRRRSTDMVPAEKETIPLPPIEKEIIKKRSRWRQRKSTNTAPGD